MFISRLHCVRPYWSPFLSVPKVPHCPFLFYLTTTKGNAFDVHNQNGVSKM